METIVAGPGGTVNAVRSEIGGVVLDKVAGGEIEAVFTAVTHKGANLLQRKNPELTYDEAAALAALGTIATISAGSSLASKIGPILKKWDLKHVKKPADVNVYEMPDVGMHTHADGGDVDVKKAVKNELRDIISNIDIGDIDAAKGKIAEYFSNKSPAKWPELEAALDKIPEHLWKGRVAPNQDGIGIRFHTPQKPHLPQDTNFKEIIRIDKGNPNAKYSSQKVDHVEIRVEGDKYVDKFGNVITHDEMKTNPESVHIPLSDWINWKQWNKP